MYGFFILLGTLAAGVGFWWAVINFFRKKSKKRPAVIFATGFAFILVGGALAPAETKTESVSAFKEEEPVVKKKALELTQAEKDAEAEAKKKAEEEKAAATKIEAEKKIVAEKEQYLAEIKPAVSKQMDMFDEAWETFWVPTFTGMSEGNMDVYTAYDNMKQLEQRYDTLYSSIPAINEEGLSKKSKEHFKKFKTNMKDATMWRGSAAEKAMELFDQGDFSPSQMDEIKGDIEVADAKMMDAIFALTKMELELGINQ